MKKTTILMTLLVTGFLASCDPVNVDKNAQVANDNVEVEVVSPRGETVAISDEGFQNAQGGVTVGGDIRNENARYIYFYSKTCSHCRDLNEYLFKNNLYDKVPLEKLELNDNVQNRERFQALTKEIGAERSGVPFIYDTVEKKFVVGTPDSINMLEGYKATENPINVEDTNTPATDTTNVEVEGNLVNE